MHAHNSCLRACVHVLREVCLSACSLVCAMEHNNAAAVLATTTPNPTPSMHCAHTQKRARRHVRAPACVSACARAAGRSARCSADANSSVRLCHAATVPCASPRWPVHHHGVRQASHPPACAPRRTLPARRYCSRWSCRLCSWQHMGFDTGRRLKACTSSFLPVRAGDFNSAGASKRLCVFEICFAE